MALGQKLRRLREDAGMTQEEVASKLNPPYSFGAVSAWESGRSNPRLSTIFDLARVFGVSVYELLDEPEGSSLVGRSAYIPLMGTAHMGGFESEENLEGRVEIPASVAENHPRAFAVHGFGSCMNRRFPEDAILVIDPEIAPRNGDAVLVESDSYEALVRVYLRGATTLVLSADSYSEDFEDVVVRASDAPVRVVGVVVWYQSSEDRRAV